MEILCTLEFITLWYTNKFTVKSTSWSKLAEPTQINLPLNSMSSEQYRSDRIGQLQVKCWRFGSWWTCPTSSYRTLMLKLHGNGRAVQLKTSVEPDTVSGVTLKMCGHNVSIRSMWDLRWQPGCEHGNGGMVWSRIVPPASFPMRRWGIMCSRKLLKVTSWLQMARVLLTSFKITLKITSGLEAEQEDVW